MTSAVTTTGLDINSVVSQLMVIERQPLTALQTKEATYQADISAYGTINSALTSLQSALTTLSNASTYSALTTNSSSSSVATATTGSTATAGTYSLTVSQLAAYNTVRTNDAVTSASSTFNTGTLAITIGSQTAVNVTIDSTNNTMSGIASAINSANAGVTASIVNDGTYQRLLLTSNTEGSAGAVTVAATDSGSGGTFSLSDLDSSNLTTVQAANDAQFSVNGLSVTRSSNSVTDVVPGLTLNLAQTGSTTLTVSKDTSGIVTAVQAFVTAYNDVVSNNTTLGTYNSTTGVSGTLNGDSTLRLITNGLGSQINNVISGVSGGLSSFGELGINLQSDGTLQLDTSTLTTAINTSGNDIASFFSQTTSGNEGLAVKFNNWLGNILGTSGLLQNRIDGLNNTITDLQNQQTDLSSRLSIIQANYTKQYTALDTLITSMNSTSTYLTSALASIASNSKSS